MEAKIWAQRTMMLSKVYISETNCITPLGFDVQSNMEQLLQGKSGISAQAKCGQSSASYAATIDQNLLDEHATKANLGLHYTKMEVMMILALQPVLASSGITDLSNIGLLISTTKGNITALQNNRDSTDQALLYDLAKTIALHFGFKKSPLVVSNACVSGILAVAVAKRLIQAGHYDDIFIVSGDLVSEFVVAGFNSFQALSDVPCKPYSAHRRGVTLGEAAAAVLVSRNRKNAKVEIVGDGAINDANHISGPSRTGEGLYLSIESALKEAAITANDIDYISAHGTATPFNDEMEAIAFNRLGLQVVPVNSFKGFYGHTLGASGLLETVIAIESMLQNELIYSMGFDEMGVTQSINVIRENSKSNIERMLKTASGFGGCNTAVIFQKV